MTNAALPDGCPHCGCQTFYRKVRFSGSGLIEYGRDADNSDMHNGVVYRESKALYCVDCKRQIKTPLKAGRAG